MNEAAAGDLLEAWEKGQTQHPLHRALTLLRMGDADQSIAALATLSIGERDRRLMAVRKRFFGSYFEAVASCPVCEEMLDLAFTAEQLSSPPPALKHEVQLEGRTITVRLPSSIDLLEVATESPDRRALLLLERCGAPDLSVAERAAAEERMAELDPMAQIEMRLACTSCGHEWTAPFDIVSYLWTEVSSGAHRLLREVHQLAQAYGWSESDIVSMDPCRRRVYLDLLMGG